MIGNFRISDDAEMIGVEYKFRGVVVIVPTRNRAQLATKAIQSVLEQPIDHQVCVMVSDNSTEQGERDELAAFCSSIEDSRLLYTRPPQPLAISEHWDWAISKALGTYDADHFVFLTDRMMFKRTSLKELTGLLIRYPDKVLSYNLDRIVDHVMPIRLNQYPATGRVFQVDSAHLLRLFSEAVFHPGLPRMLNCLVPRSVLERVRQRFGNIFSSIAPDFNFCFRCLETEASILFFDKSPVFHYALNRSTGASASRGELTPDNLDFIANLPVESAVRNYATPIPQLITAVNAAFNEYLILKSETKSSRFFSINPEKYLHANAVETMEVSDSKLRSEMLALLADHGYKEPANESKVRERKVSITSLRWRLISAWKKVVLGARTKRIWLFLARYAGVAPPGDVLFEFWSREEAIDYIQNISRGNFTRDHSGLKLLNGTERDTDSN